MNDMNHEKNQPQMRLLALDTATAVMAAAVVEAPSQQLIEEKNIHGERNHSVHVLTGLQELMLETGTAREQIAGIAVGIGPGSYTGVRIAVTAAKTLAWAWKVPVVGVSTLQALAWGGWNRAQAGKAAKHSEESQIGGTVASPAQAEEANYIQWIVPLLDARRGQVYTSLFAAAGRSEPRRLAPDAIRLMSSWVEELVQLVRDTSPQERPKAIYLVGETEVHQLAATELAELLELRAQPYELEGRWIGRIGATRLQDGQEDELHTLVPNYTQLAEAEVNLLQARTKGAIST